MEQEKANQPVVCGEAGIQEKHRSPFWTEESALSSDPTSRRARRHPPKRLRSAFSVMGAGMLVAAVSIVILLVMAWIQSQAAVQVVQDQAEAIREGEVEKAYALFSSSYRAGTSLTSFQRWLSRQQELAGSHDLRIVSRSVRSGTAVLWGSLTDAFGRSHPIRYELIRENGNWRIDNVQLQSSAPDALPQSPRFQYI